MDNKQRSREKIEKDFNTNIGEIANTSDLYVEQNRLALEVALDIRDLLTEQSKKQRRPARVEDLCKECSGSGKVFLATEETPTGTHRAIYGPCIACSPNPQQ